MDPSNRILKFNFPLIFFSILLLFLRIHLIILIAGRFHLEFVGAATLMILTVEMEVKQKMYDVAMKLQNKKKTLFL